ncbi:dynein heavy chain related protein [Cyclospora cayetanensis]|uniref:Dynein heavy chain related protein n=1 Tax=Cyclospora cayetanensis TaxID=88456 RepID=A0A1D3D139_9EIME|nr:dynein heavy chain related protein [Cyclospora cayetanensis]
MPEEIMDQNTNTPEAASDPSALALGRSMESLPERNGAAPAGQRLAHWLIAQIQLSSFVADEDWTPDHTRELLNFCNDNRRSQWFLWMSKKPQLNPLERGEQGVQREKPECKRLAFSDKLPRHCTNYLQQHTSSKDECGDGLVFLGKKCTGVFNAEAPEDLTNITKCASDRELVQRLEALVNSWTRQMKEILAVQDGPEGSLESCHLGEIQRWTERAQNLKSLIEQFHEPDIQAVIDVLNEAKSSCAKHFQSVQKDIVASSRVVHDNLKFLEVLRGPCQALREADPTEIPMVATQLLMAVRIVATHSKYYTTPERISTEVIRRGQASVDIDSIWAGDVAQPMESLRNAVECGVTLNRVFKQLSTLIKSEGKACCWDSAAGAAFAEFQFSPTAQSKQKDLMCSSADSANLCSTPQGHVYFPTFGPFQTEVIRSNIRNIQQEYGKALSRLRVMGRNILNVKATSWHNEYAQFKEQVRDHESMYMNVIASAFKRAATVEEACEIFGAFKLLAKRPNIQRFLEKKASDIWRLFSQLHDIREVTISEDGKDAEQALRLYENVTDMLQTFVEKSFQEWLQEAEAVHPSGHTIHSPDIPLFGCDRHLFTRTKGGGLELNFNKELHRVLQEAHFWQYMQDQIIRLPFTVLELLKHRDRLFLLQQHILGVPDERRLFQQHVGSLDRKIAPGIEKLTWNSKGIKEYFVRDAWKDCQAVCEYVTRFLYEKKAITRIIEESTHTRLIFVDKKNTVELEGFLRQQGETQQAAVLAFQRQHSEIVGKLQRIEEVQSQPTGIN